MDAEPMITEPCRLLQDGRNWDEFREQLLRLSPHPERLGFALNRDVVRTNRALRMVVPRLEYESCRVDVALAAGHLFWASTRMGVERLLPQLRPPPNYMLLWSLSYAVGCVYFCFMPIGHVAGGSSRATYPEYGVLYTLTRCAADDQARVLRVVY